MAKSKRKSDCPINFGLEIFGDKWTLLIVRDLMFKGRHYYGEFLQSGEGIATNVLADRLAMLEANGIVLKSIDAQSKAKYLYRLSEKGIELMPVLVEIILWSAKHDPLTAADPAFVERANHDREGLIAELSQKLRDQLAEA